jgi:flagellar motor switch protein FliN/FliY
MEPAEPISKPTRTARTLPESVADMPLNVHVSLGQARLLLKDIFKMTVGSIIELGQSGDELPSLIANGKVTARGRLVIMKGQYGLRVVSKVANDKSGR